MSTAQKGRSDLRLASLRRDRELVDLARQVAFDLVGGDVDLERSPVLAEEIRVLLSDDDSEFLAKS